MERNSRKYSDENAESFVDINEISNKPKNSMKFYSVRILAAFLSVICIIIGGGLLYYYNIISSINYDFKVDTSPLYDALSSDSDKSSDTSKNNIILSDEKLLSDSNVLNIMLFGSDNAHGADFGRSDTMILLTVDNIHKEVKMTSFMRDLWVNIPNYGMDRINVAYALGGPARAVQAIEANFGISIDRYAVVDFSSFKQIIDILGGIDIELTGEEIDYINWQTYKNNQADTRYELPNTPGIVHLNGRQALWHARNRGADGICSGSDYTRTARQRQVLKTLIKNMKKASLTDIIKIVNSVGPMVTTNLSYYEITVLCSNALSYLKYDVFEYRIPQYDNVSDANIDAKQVLTINDWTLARQELANFVFGEGFEKEE